MGRTIYNSIVISNYRAINHQLGESAHYNINLCCAITTFLTFVVNEGLKIPPCISRLLDQIETKFQQLPPFSMTAIPMELSVKLSDVT